MTRLEGSIARDAFREATALLAAQRLTSPVTRPAVDYVGGLSTADTQPPGSWSVGPDDADLGPLHAAAVAIGSGALSAREAVEAALLAVDKRNAELGAIVEVADAKALAEADRLDAELAEGLVRGPLHGIPITVKDVIDVAGLPTRAGSAAYRRVPTRDASSVSRLRAAGAVVIGKAATHEFALGVTSPRTRNPIDPTRLAGGSSGGSAAALGSGMGLGSLGTDTRASIRVPAALSGMVGFKPTYGTVATDGVVTLSWTMDHVAPMAVTVADAALLLEVLAPGCGGSQAILDAGVRGLRVGLPPAAFADTGPGVADAVEHAVGALGALGAIAVDVERPDALDLEMAGAIGLIVSRCEAASAHRSLVLDRSLYWQEVAEQLDEAEQVAAVDYLDAQRARAELRDRMRRVFDQVDVLAMPTATVTAPPVDDFARYLVVLARNAIPWSLVGFPAVSLPCGLVGGLPVGLQLVAAPGRDDLLVATAFAVEQALAVGPT